MKELVNVLENVVTVSNEGLTVNRKNIVKLEEYGIYQDTETGKWVDLDGNFLDLEKLLDRAKYSLGHVETPKEMETKGDSFMDRLRISMKNNGLGSEYLVHAKKLMKQGVNNIDALVTELKKIKSVKDEEYDKKLQKMRSYVEKNLVQKANQVLRKNMERVLGEGNVPEILFRTFIVGMFNIDIVIRKNLAEGFENVIVAIMKKLNEAWKDGEIVMKKGTENYLKWKVLFGNSKRKTNPDMPQWVWERNKLVGAIVNELGLIVTSREVTDVLTVTTNPSQLTSKDSKEELLDAMEYLEKVHHVDRSRFSELVEFSDPRFIDWTKGETEHEGYVDRFCFHIDVLDLLPVVDKYRATFKVGRKAFSVEYYAPNLAGKYTKGSGRKMDELTVASLILGNAIRLYLDEMEAEEILQHLVGIRRLPGLQGREETEFPEEAVYEIRERIHEIYDLMETEETSDPDIIDLDDIPTSIEGSLEEETREVRPSEEPPEEDDMIPF